MTRRPAWTCRKCGYSNRISLDSIYDTQAAWQNGQAPVDREAFIHALKVRTREVEKEKKKKN